MKFTTPEEILSYDVSDIPIDSYWNSCINKEKKIHRIHSYPAKFPAFIATKAIDYAQSQGLKLSVIADVFCGCGTVAVEAKENNLDFWGCDINPVATLIAEVKSENYDEQALQMNYDFIQEKSNGYELKGDEYLVANERIKYWFDETQFLDLYKLYKSICDISDSKYRKAFLCVFSSILKVNSKWLNKSIKPQLDPNKIRISVKKSFDNNFKKLLVANRQEYVDQRPKIEIHTTNFLEEKSLPRVDMIITSPPYVTSYEYADLHQLSTVWLGFASDYRELRKGSIGSIYNQSLENDITRILFKSGADIIEQLERKKGVPKSKIHAVTRYYSDIQEVTRKCYGMLNTGGIAFFIVGDTEYFGVKIENSRHLLHSLLESGFSEVEIVKRKISNKLLTPYRDESGKFSSVRNKKEIYHEEFVIIGKKYERE